MNDSIVDSGVCWSAGMYLPSENGKRAAFHILNPADSGVLIYVDRVEANCPDASAFWTLRSHNTSLSQVANPCNMKFGAGGVGVFKAALTMDQVNEIPGNLHSEFYRVTGRPLVLAPAHTPLIELVPGKGLAIVCHSEGRAVCSPEWREIVIG